MDFKYKLDDFQEQAIESIKRDESILVCASTGCGKTVCGMYGIAHNLLKGLTVAYTTPIKTLSNQKYKEIKDYFEHEFKEKHNIKVNVGLVTGDQKINTEGNVLIMTAEILLHSLYGNTIKDKSVMKPVYFSDDFITNLGCVVMDEVHFINDKDRGYVWEETIMLLNKNVTLVMLSATISEPESFAKWISNIKEKPINYISAVKRVIPLEHFICVDDQLFKVLDKDNIFNDDEYNNAFIEFNDYSKNRYTPAYTLNKAIKYMKNKNLLQCIIFMFSRANCEKYAKLVTIELINFEERNLVEQTYKQYLTKYKEKYELLDQYNVVMNLALKGIGFHHSGLLPILKEIVEILFSRGLIKVLFATETFAVGVNMPCRTVLMTNLEKPSNEGRRLLFASEYKQMAGRAGRRGIDSFGTVILLPLFEMPNNIELRNCMLGSMPNITSKFDINYSFLLKIIKSESYNISEFVMDSLYGISHKNELAKLNEQLDILKLHSSQNETNLSDTIKYKSEFDEYVRLLELDEEYSNPSSLMKLNKQQIKRKKKLNAMINNNPDSKKLFEQYTKNFENESSILKIENRISDIKSHISDSCSKLISLFVRFGYIKTLKTNDDLVFEDLNMKAIIASNINDCNPLILTEMIVQNVFDGLDCAEIIALLGIFVDDCKGDERKLLSEIKCSDKVVNRILFINRNIIDEYVLEEKRLDIKNHMMGYWDLYYEHVDMCYNWANGQTYKELSKSIDIYEGNFVKTMLKITNIIRNLIDLYKISGVLSLLPQLEMLEGLVMRDIVGTNSLYLE